MQPVSAVAVGRAFERATAARLAALGATLTTHSGGAFDQCVDLAGHLPLPTPLPYAPWPGDRVALRVHARAPPLRVPLVVQCKATAAPAGVAVMRELQHAVAARFPRGTLAVLACTGGFALGALRRERAWVLRDVLLLHLSAEGGLLSAAMMAPLEGEDIGLWVSTQAISAGVEWGQF